MNKQKTIKINITGIVQNVGFRFFIQKKALCFNLGGYVRNNNNGSVDILLQGNSISIQTFLSFITKKSPGRIDNISTEDMKTDIKYKGFDILKDK